jgi:hypothetical protein
MPGEVVFTAASGPPRAKAPTRPVPVPGHQHRDLPGPRLRHQPETAAGRTRQPRTGDLSHRPRALTGTFNDTTLRHRFSARFRYRSRRSVCSRDRSAPAAIAPRSGRYASLKNHDVGWTDVGQSTGSADERARCRRLRVMLRTASSLPLKGLRRWASARPVSRPSCQPATGPPGSYPDRTLTGRRRRAYEHEDPPWHYVTVSPPVLLGARKGRG